jgi:hypothetical protein
VRSEMGEAHQHASPERRSSAPMPP